MYIYMIRYVLMLMCMCMYACLHISNRIKSYQYIFYFIIFGRWPWSFHPTRVFQKSFVFLKVKPRHFCFSHTAFMKLLPLREAMKLELKCREQAPHVVGPIGIFGMAGFFVVYEWVGGNGWAGTFHAFSIMSRVEGSTTQAPKIMFFLSILFCQGVIQVMWV